MIERRVMLAAAAGVLSLACVVASARTMDAYYGSRPIWVEQVAYLQFPAIQYLSMTRNQGRLATAVAIIRDRERHALQPLLYSLVWPDLLAYRHAHLFITTPALFAFLYLVGRFAAMRVPVTMAAIATMSLFVAAAGLTNSRHGIASGFADEQAFVLLAAGSVCLLIALETTKDERARWCRWSAVAVALATFSRTTAGFHAVVIAGPLFVLVLWRTMRRDGGPRVAGRLLAQFCLFLAPAILLVLWQLAPLLWYYTSANAWQLKQPLIVSARSLASLSYTYVGPAYLLLAALTFTVWVALRLFARRYIRFTAAGAVEIALVWWSFGFLGFLLWMGYTSDVPKEVMYTLPGITTLTMVPFGVRELPRPDLTAVLHRGLSRGQTAGLVMLCSVVTIAALAVLVTVASQNRLQASRNEPYMIEWRVSQRAMAAFLARLPDGIVWQSYTWPDWAIPVSLLEFWEHGRIQRGGTLFVNRREYWETQYPGLSPAEIEAELYRRTNESVDVALTLSDPKDEPMGMEPFSRTLASGIAIRIGTDPAWRRIGEVPGAPFSKQLTVYVRQSGRAAGYPSLRP
jgi:hypothetical protein